jgi:hypothetical protein
MFPLPSEPFERPSDLSDVEDPKVLYVRSYLMIRSVVGVLGVLLPLVFIIGEAFLQGSVRVRGSLSAYYHSSMRDVFVAGLCVVGFMLITYMAGQRRRPDWWLSTLAGVAVLFVVFFPANRPGLTEASPRCGSSPEPVGCSSMQQALGETVVATVHFASATIFITSLALACLYFAARERKSGNLRAAAVQRACGVVILAAITWVVVGGLLHFDIGPLTPLYLGEVCSVWAFAGSWLTGSRDLWRQLLPIGKPSQAAKTAVAV